MSRKVLQQALKAQEAVIKDLQIRAQIDENPGVLNISNSVYLKLQKSIESIKAELKKPAAST